MKDSHQDIRRVYTHNDTDTGYAERRDTRQSAARPGRAPQDQPCARAMLKRQQQRSNFSAAVKRALARSKTAVMILVPTENGMRRPLWTFENKISETPSKKSSFLAVFVGDSVTPMSTLAHNKRSCSKKWKTSGQNCVFPVFPAKILARFCHAVLDFREHQGLPPD